MWTVEYILSQVCMALAMALVGITYFIKSNKNILVCSIVSAVFFCGHYLFLGSYIALALNAIGLIRGVWYYFANKSSRKSQTIAMLTIIIINIISGLATLQTWIDILPLMASTMYCYDVWQKNILYYRAMAVIEGVMWVAYNIYLASIVGILSQSILLVASIVGVILYTFKTKREQVIESKSKQNKEININEDTV